MERLAEEDGNAVTGSAIFRSGQSSSIIQADQVDGDTIRVRHQTAALSDELALALKFSQDDIDFVQNGGALVDSEILGDLVTWNENTEAYEPLPTRIVRRGGGIGQPGPEVYVAADLPTENGSDAIPALPHDTLVRFEEPVSPQLADALRSEVRTRLELPRSFDDDLFRWILAGLAASLLFSLALSSSNLAAVELEDEFSMLVSLGASPKVRPRVLAAQSAWLLGLGVATGSVIGTVLFWLVTRGDESVPDPIVPVGGILTLVGTAVLVTIVIRFMHSPADAAVSSRPKTMVDA